MDYEQLFAQTVEHVRETSLLESTSALLEWDERTGLPEQAGDFRAEQITLLSGIIHRRKTDPQFGQWLDTLCESAWLSSASDQRRAAVARLFKDFQRNQKLPLELVQAISKATVLGQQAWERARHEDDWSSFEPHMDEIFSLRRREAELLQDGGSLYDALLDRYEEGANSAELTQIFAGLRDALVRIVQELAAAPRRPGGASWKESVCVEKQRRISRWIAEQIGYSFRRGRLDETSHPFCSSLGPDDCRILTRYDKHFFPTGFFGTLHEAGHGLYEQGLPSEWYGLAPGMAAGLGIHESQSRLWENMVGRSRAFWQWCYPQIARSHGLWQNLDAEQLFHDTNLVEPSLIRVEADEVTYNLHILIRFEIEQELIAGNLRIADAPHAWDQRYEHYLGIRAPSAKNGILQDVHWSAGLIGYFPTYTIGNLYAAQLMQAAEVQLGDTARLVGAGEFSPLLDWLRENIHRHGFCYDSGPLVERATGAPLTAQPLVDYLRQKLEPLYGL